MCGDLFGDRKQYTRVASFYIRNKQKDKGRCHQFWIEDVGFEEDIPQTLLDIGVNQNNWKRMIETANGNLKYLKYLFIAAITIGVLLSTIAIGIFFAIGNSQLYPLTPFFILIALYWTAQEMIFKLTRRCIWAFNSENLDAMRLHWIRNYNLGKCTCFTKPGFDLWVNCELLDGQKWQVEDFYHQRPVGKSYDIYIDIKQQFPSQYDAFNINNNYV